MERGLRERPLTENGGLSERPLKGKQRILELKITKKRIFFKRIFLKRGSFGAAHVEKVESLGAAKAKEMGGFRAAHTRTVRLWEYTSTDPLMS